MKTELTRRDALLIIFSVAYDVRITEIPGPEVYLIYKRHSSNKAS